MTFQTYTDHTKLLAKGNGGGGGRWAWKTNQALLGTFSLMAMTLILGLVWENTSSGGFALVFTQDSPKLIDHIRFGDAVKTHALWASSEELNESGERMREVDPSIRTVSHEVKIDLSSSHDVAQRLEGVTNREVEPNNPTNLEEDRTPLPTSNLSMTTKASEMQLGPSTVRSKRVSSSINALITGKEISNSLELKGLHKVSSKQQAHGSDKFTTDNIDLELIDFQISSRSGSKNGVCDLTKGYWVKDEKPPFYSGKECKAYLSSGFACRLMTRPDFEYEKLRWQPEECDLPSFTGNGFLQRLRNKVVAFVGDSLGRQQFQSLMCMITEGKDDKNVEDVKRMWGRETKWAYRFRETNTTILFHWSASLCEIEQGHPEEEPGYSAMHLDRPPRFLKNSFHEIDVMVLNTGHHWNRGKLQNNKWHQYVDGKPLVDRKLAGITDALNFTVHKVVRWLDEKLSDAKHHPAVFFRTFSPRHFKNGDWDSGGRCDSTRSQYRPSVTEDKMVKSTLPVYSGPRTETVAELAVKGTRVTLLNITHISKLREEGHISKYGIGKDSTHQDCLHWCLPGVPDVWNELLYANLLNDPRLSPMSDDH